MMSVLRRLTQSDLQFIAATLMPEEERGPAAARLREEDDLLERLLDDARLLPRIEGDVETLVRVSPWLLFSVLLRHARRALRGLSYTVERAQGERVAGVGAA